MASAVNENIIIKVREELVSLSEENYRKFSSGLLPGTDNILGVRLPMLRRLARRLAAGEWQGYVESHDRESFEEIMLHGMILGYIKVDRNTGVDFQHLLVYIRKFVPWINNWSVCDSFCAGLKVFRDYPEEGWRFLEPYAHPDKEYEVRFALVMYLNHYVNLSATVCKNTDYMDRIIERAINMKADGYYAQMAAAWLMAECYVNSPDKVIPLQEKRAFNTFVHNKMISKICESYKVAKEEKPALKALRRRVF